MHDSNSRDRRRSMDISDLEIRDRKAFLEFTDEDIAVLESVNDMANAYADPVVEDFYRHLMSFDVGKQYFTDRAVLERVKRAQKEYFKDLTRGQYGRPYIENRLRIGTIHERIGLPIKAYLGMYAYYVRSVSSRLAEGLSGDPARARKAFNSLVKIMFLDMGLAIDTYVFQRERTINLQQDAIRELSTPVLQVREGLLILPIVGVLDSMRALQVTEQLLRGIRAKRAKVVVIDVTGVPSVDSRVASHLVQTIEAARLMGATGILTGLAPEIAQTLVTIGVDLSNIQTVGDLQGGIEMAERMLGYQVTRP